MNKNTHPKAEEVFEKHAQFLQSLSLQVKNERLSKIIRQMKSLRDFAWQQEVEAAGPRFDAAQIVSGYLHGILEQQDNPNIILCSGSEEGGYRARNGNGKTHVAEGIIRFLVLNCNVSTIETVDWSEFVLNHFDDGPGNINWNADVLLIEDLDTYRPVRSSLNPWALELLTSVIKPRIRKRLYTIYTMNRDPAKDDFPTYLATSPDGKSNVTTEDAAMTLRSSLAGDVMRIKVNETDVRAIARFYGPDMRLRQGTYLKQMAIKQDMSTFGFPSGKEY